jgi:PPPDE putative peptidase domain
MTLFCCGDSSPSSNKTNFDFAMSDLKDVILHVYQLTDIAPVPAGHKGSSPNAGNDAGNWFTRTFLPSIGLGAYHTSLQIYGYRYTFTGNYGIVKCFSHIEITGLPPNAVFQESICLGRTKYYKDEIAQIVKILGDKMYTNNTYNMVHRNCNHFTETFATALLLGEKLSQRVIGRLEEYPAWINRLANTGQSFITKEDDGESWKPVDEARKAVGLDWSVEESIEDSIPCMSNVYTQTKKEMTTAQRAALAKVRQK